MKMNSLSKKVIGIASILIVIGTLLALPATDVYANDPYLDANVPTSGMKDKDIEAMNQHEISWLRSQNQVFRDIYLLDSNFQDLVNSEISKRGEAIPLQTALNDFEAALVVAQSVHDEAAKVIGKQWGFDAQGKVTNHQAALDTVISARYSLRDAHYRLVVSTHTMKRAYADWRAQFIH
jgi:hypothetical protein